jgi:hypothetical protein
VLQILSGAERFAELFRTQQAADVVGAKEHARILTA